MLTDKDGKIYEFRVHFDKKVEPIILKYEAAIYHFGEKFVGFDLSPYIDTFSNPNFAGSDCYIQLFMPMRFFPKEQYAKIIVNFLRIQGNNQKIFSPKGLFPKENG